MSNINEDFQNKNFILESQKVDQPIYTLHNKNKSHWTVEVPKEKVKIVNAFDVLKHADKQTLDNFFAETLLESQPTCQSKIVVLKNVEIKMTESHFRQNSEVLLNILKKKLPKTCTKINFEVILEDTIIAENEILSQKNEVPVTNSNKSVSETVIKAAENDAAAKNSANSNEYPNKVDMGIVIEANQGMRFPCSICNRNFADANGLNRHVFAKHSNSKKKYCALCESSFRAQENLEVHYTNRHKCNMLRKCRICCFQFKKLETLQSHFDDYHSSKPFKCKKCDRLFKELHHRNKHEEKCKNVQKSNE